MNVVDCKPRVSARKTSCWKMFLLALGTPQAKPRNGLIQLQVEKVKKKEKNTEVQFTSSRSPRKEEKHHDRVARSDPRGTSHPAPFTSASDVCEATFQTTR